MSEETSRMREAWGQDKSELTRLKLALLLATNANADDGELMALLEPLVQDAVSAKPEIRALAALVHGAAYERKHIKDGLATAQARLREAQKSQETSLARVEQQRRQIEDLEKKLNALMTIEKSLIQRTDTPPK
jgi:predicted  nucleic acid-binding Zn-ribbon protein